MEPQSINTGDDEWLSKNFIIKKKIGAGSFGRVYKVKPKTGPNGTFAVKIMPLMNDDDHLALELNILKNIGGLNSVIGSLCLYRSTNEVYAVMPYIRHSNFKDFVNVLTGLEVYKYATELFSALSYLHDHDIAHLDVKPNNFLFDRRKNIFALIDFGLCRRVSHDTSLNDSIERQTKCKRKKRLFQEEYDENAFPPPKLKKPMGGMVLTNRQVLASKKEQMKCNCARLMNQTCAICSKRQPLAFNSPGTPGYRAPETILLAQDLSTPADVWAAGIVLLQLLFGRTPLMRDRKPLTALMHISILRGIEPTAQLASKYMFNFNMIPRPPPHGLDLWRLAIFSRNTRANVNQLLKVKCNVCQQFIGLLTDQQNAIDNCYCFDPADNCQPKVAKKDRLADLSSDQLFSLRSVLYGALTVDPRQRMTATECAMNLSMFPVTP